MMKPGKGGKRHRKAGARALLLATLLALVHAGLWGAGIYWLKAQQWRDMVPRQVILRELQFTNKDPDRPARSYWRLYLTVQPLDAPSASPQRVVPSGPTDALRRYADQHKVGQIVTVWSNRTSGWVSEVFPPDPPDLLLISGIALLIVGPLTWFLALAIFSLRPQHVAK